MKNFLARIIRNEIAPDNAIKWEDWMARNDGKAIKITLEVLDDQRTIPQNNAIHLWCDQVAVALNEAGIDIKKFYEVGMDVPWNKNSVKEYIWRVGMEYHHLPSTSTKKLKKEQVSNVYEVCNRALGARGIHIPFPERFIE